MKSPAKEYRPRLVALALLVCLASCQRRPPEPAPAIIAAGEPEVYAATVIRKAVDGEAREQSTSQVARRGDWRREQWMEEGSARALILRPDLGKTYLLDLDQHVYVELDFAAATPLGALSSAAHETAPADARPAPASLQPEAIDRAFDEATATGAVEARALADQTVQGYACQVIESRATFADGRVEITRSHRARALAGLPLLVEVQSPNGARLTVERRDIQLDVSPDEFTVPADFKRVARLPPGSKP